MRDDARARFLAEAGTGLVAALQPIIEYQSGNVMAYEALARGRGPLASVTPGEIFKAAADHDAIFEVEMCLAARAVEAFSARRADHWGLLFLNLHGALVENWARVADAICALLDDAGLIPTDICIEISEANHTLPMEDLAAATTGLRARGFRIAVDDFGAGYSGLSMLYHARPEFLKIDRFFIQDIARDAKKRLFVGSIVDLAHVLGIRVIAEGVETGDELHACGAIRCDLAQGFHISRPSTEPETLKARYPVPSAVPRGERSPLSRYLETPAAVTLDTPRRDALETILRDGGQQIVPVLDSAGCPLGILREADLRPIFSCPLVRDLAQHGEAEFSLADHLCPILTVDISTPIGPLLDLVSDAAEDGVLVTDNMRYVGHVSPASLIRLTGDIRLNLAGGQKLLTRLPTTGAITADISARLLQTGSDRLFARVVIDGFMPFNAAYGFEAGDHAIQLCAEGLRTLPEGGDIFIGHLRGAAFFVAASGADASALPWKLDAFRDRFAETARSLFTESDQRAGGFEVRTADGETVEVPLIGCRIVTLLVPAHVGVPQARDIREGLIALTEEAEARGLRNLHQTFGEALPQASRSAG